MEWTNEVPTVPGHYWYTDPVEPATVVRVARRTDGICGLAAEFPGRPQRYPVTGGGMYPYRPGAQWAGPLDLPQRLF